MVGCSVAGRMLSVEITGRDDIVCNDLGLAAQPLELRSTTSMFLIMSQSWDNVVSMHGHLLTVHAHKI